MAERKVVTVLFADLARSTELANMLDPERFRDLLSTFYALVSRELASLRGRAEKFAGDAVMAVFGLPHAHEDDALRAVRAGLIIRDRTAKLGERAGLHRPLGVRVGINSGPVAAGLIDDPASPSDRPLVSGAAVNLAARLQQAAAPNEILVGDTTRQLTRYSVAFGEPRVVRAKGFREEVRAWPVEALSTRSSRRTIPLVGREREMRLLQDTFDRVRDSSRAHLLTVLGEAGIGKSRLVDELAARLPEDTKLLSGRTGDFEEDVTYAPVAQMLRREVGLPRDAPSEDVRARLREIVDACCDPTDTERVAARLGLALGLGDEGREGRRYRAAELRAGLAELLEGLVRRGPVVMVFEDMHHARPGLLDMIEQLLVSVRRMPVLIVAVGRDYLLDERPGWGKGVADSLTIRLESLSAAEGRELAVVAGESLDENTADRIALHAGGNPFFIVETTGMLIQEHPDHAEGTPHSHLLPPTVQAVVASRIDHLSEDARDLIRKASVFAGSTFDRSDLQVVAQPRDELIQTLEDAELLVRDHDRSGTWRFRHEMLREVAYESLPKRERRRLHLAVAEALTNADENRNSGAVAFHLEQAARAGLDLDPGDRSLADRAVDALTQAGDRARWRIESRAALDLYERALALAGPEEQWALREARILSRMGEARYWLGEFEPAAAVLERALELGGDDPWTQAHASRFLGDIELNVRASPDRAETLFRRALDASRTLGDPHAEARTLVMGGWVHFWRGDNDGARAMFEDGLSIARSNPEGDPWAEARALTSLASVISPVGDERECLALAEQALDLGREMHDPFTQAVAQEYVGNSFRRMGMFDEAMERLDAAVRTFRDLDARWELASSLTDRGFVRRLQGNMASAEEDLRRAVRMCRELGERNLITWSAERLVRVLVERGEPVEARRILTEVETLLDPSDRGGRMALLGSEIEILLGEGDRDGARKLGGELLDMYRESGPSNETAGMTWWMARLFGPESVGGEAVMEEARRTLEAAHWNQALADPDLFAEALRARGLEVVPAP